MHLPDSLDPILDPTRVGSDYPTTDPTISDGASADGLGADGAAAVTLRKPVHQAIDYLTAALLDVQHIRRATEETTISVELDEQFEPVRSFQLAGALAGSTDFHDAELLPGGGALLMGYDSASREGVSYVDAIIQVANENDIPFFSSDRDTVERGAFATVGFRYYDHGYQAGEMAVEILKNGKKPSELPVSFPDKLDFILNLKAAAEQNITVTDAMKAVVQDQANNIIE